MSFYNEYEVHYDVGNGVSITVLVVEAENEEQAKRFAQQSLDASAVKIPSDLADDEVTVTLTGRYGGY